MEHALYRFLDLHEKQGLATYSGNHVTLLKDGEQTYACMFEKVKAAKKRILLESYIFEEDGFGAALSELLIKKVQRGCRVAIIYDSAGSYETDQSHFDRLRDAGIFLCEYNPLRFPSLHSFKHLHHRNHRKIMVIDDEYAFTGGINISKVYGSGSTFHHQEEDETNRTHWRDTHVLIEGPVVQAFADLIEETLQRENADYDVMQFPQDKLTPSGDMIVSVVDSVGNDRKNPIQHIMIAALRAAQDSIFITNAYFSPGRIFLRELKCAARRGVNVHLLLPEETDWTILRYASESHYAGLLKAGVHIHRYQRGMLHAKTIVIDEIWSTVGSSNLDYRSLKFNDEANAIVINQEFASNLHKLFVNDLSRADQLSLSYWRKRGVKQRLCEFTGKMLRRWL